jgi:hypothetical protein
MSLRLPLAVVLLSGCALAQQPVGEVFASDATVQGSVQLTGAGATVLSGASVTAGAAAARLRLSRGGDLRVCSGTSVAVSASASGRELMFAMGTGAIEADYRLQSSADTIMTADFRILLAGPGNFRFALGSGANGDTCIQARASNSAALVVTEVMGDATYQVKPNEHVLFRKGRIAGITADPPEDCGCPPAPETLRAEAEPPPPDATGLMASQPPAAQPPPSPEAAGVQVEVDAPFVFRAEEVGPLPWQTRRETLASLPALPAAEALPPPAPAPVETAAAATATATAAVESKIDAKKKKKGAFSRLRSFFAAIFK